MYLFSLLFVFNSNRKTGSFALICPNAAVLMPKATTSCKILAAHLKACQIPGPLPEATTFSTVVANLFSQLCCDPGLKTALDKKK